MFFLLIAFQFDLVDHLKEVSTMFDQESDGVFEQIVCNPQFTADELITIKRLEWEHKALSTTTTKLMTRIQLISRAVYIISCLMMKNGFYAVKEILHYLTPKEFIIIAAACDTLLLEFFTPESVLSKKMFTWLCTKYKWYSMKPNMKHLCSLSNGQTLRKELKMFNLKGNLGPVIDDFRWLPKKLKQRMMVKFNPCYPIVAIKVLSSVYILAYAGPMRQEKGQILYCINRRECEALYIKWISWNSTGNFLLMTTKEQTPSNSHYELIFSVCKCCFFRGGFSNE